MRVLFIGPGQRSKFRFFYYSFYSMLLRGLMRTNHNVMAISDRDIVRSAFFGIEKIGKLVLKNRVLETIENFKPDIILLAHADFIDVAILEAIKATAPHIKIAWIDCDAFTDTAVKRFDWRLYPKQKFLDAVFFTTAGQPLKELRAKGFTAHYIPNPLDEGIVDLRAQSIAEMDIGLAAGSNSRFMIVDQLKRIDPQIKTIEIGRDGKRLYGVQFIEELSRARFGLNVSVFEQDLYSSDRIAILFGLGLCVCVHSSTGFQRFFDDTDLIFFNSVEDLYRQVTEMSKGSEWFERGKRGRERYLSLFGSRRIADFIITKLLSEPGESYEWNNL